MFADVAFDLVKSLERSSHQVIPPFNVNKISIIWYLLFVYCNINDCSVMFILQDDGVRQVLEEIKAIFDENCAQA